MDTASTAQTYTLFTPEHGDLIRAVGAIVTESFKDTADTAQNTNTVSVGDTNDIDNFILAQEMNGNTTVVNYGYSTGDALPLTVTQAATIYDVVVTLGSTSGKKISHLNQGRVVILFNLFRPSAALTARSTGSE